MSSVPQPATAALLDRLAGEALPLPRRKGSDAAEKLRDLVETARLSPATEGILPALAGGPLHTLLLGIADHSSFLWRLVHRDPARLARLVTRSPEESLREIVLAQRSAWRAPSGAAVARDALARSLRRRRAELALLVALADLGGVWNLDAVTTALTEFADASVACAADALLFEAAAAGKLGPNDSARPQQGSGLVVLALGKHGAGELNYSSDIDLVVFFDAERAPLAQGVEPTTFFSRLAQGLARLLQERTPEGYVHRVDYRLRPDPGSTPTALSLGSAYAYYETLGQNWERAALIKARPIAGDLDVGERFLSDLAPFIWRKYFDFASIADVHAMKRQIHAVRGHDKVAVAGHDIKLGRGGIREVEFFVQTQQLVFGGRRPGLRGRRTLDMLEALTGEGWITSKARDELSEAYVFLRTIEHRLQMVADEQTQRLPSDPQALEGFARFCGRRDLPAFERDLCREARKVEGHYALLFEEGPELASDLGNLVFTGTADDPETLATLGRLGFRDPAAVAETVRGWHFGRRPAVTSPRAREVLTELVPSLLAALGGTIDPDAALAALDRAFGRMPAAVELLNILQSHDRLRLLFADLLGTAPRLADTVAYSPHVLDAIIDPTFAEPKSDDEPIEARVRQLIGRPAHYEDFLDRVRDAARQMRFLAGARMLSGVFAPEQAGKAYAAIAGAVIRACLDEVGASFAAEHGRVPGAKVAVLGLGRLGSRELTAGSDLDLVVLYDFEEACRESDGARPLDATVYHIRLAQRLLAALTAPTRRGRLYDVDLRLRPQGGKGPVATQFRGFLAYQQNEAELWEHMALTRARVLAGDPGFGAEVGTALRRIVASCRDPARVAADVAAMRDLVASEKGDQDPWDLKLARGGLTDLDFLAQALTLAHAGGVPELAASPSTPETLRTSIRSDILAPADGEILLAAYRLFDDVHHWQRLLVEGPFTAGSAGPAVRRRLAAAVGLPDEAVLLQHLGEERARVREIMERLLREKGLRPLARA